MKITKWFCKLLLLAIIAVFISCDKEGEVNYDPELIGTWGREDTFEEITNVEVFTFNEDLTGLYNIYEKEDTVEVILPSLLTYTVENNIISITMQGWDSTISGSYTLSTPTGASFERLHLTIEGESNIYNRLYLGGYH